MEIQREDKGADPHFGFSFKYRVRSAISSKFISSALVQLKSCISFPSLLADGSLSLEKIAELLALPLDEVKKFVKAYMWHLQNGGVSSV